MNRGQAVECVDSRNHPCSVCRQGVGCNSIMCVRVTERCSGILGI